jgi:Co/Zn/Cd efflux system component
MGQHCCGASVQFDGLSPDYIRRLRWVVAINAAMFCVEMSAGMLAQSQALQADALDFAADTATYGLSLWVIGKSLHHRSAVALVKGFSLLLMGLWVVGSTLYRVLNQTVPDAPVMASIAVLALIANVASVLLLMKYKDGDANVRSVWLCSRNDAIGNVLVVAAAAGVWGSRTGWPDLAVAAILGTLFLSSALQVLRQALAERRAIKHDSHVH